MLNITAGDLALGSLPIEELQRKNWAAGFVPDMKSTILTVINWTTGLRT
jgi:hypothetical protein|tara:strand:- start:89 stop:235 length:147 start_codon:yes stop_codon:yes gene_type:complete